MTDIVDLTVREFDGEFAVTFDLPYGGWEVLGTFATQEEAVVFMQQQIATADLSA